MKKQPRKLIEGVFRLYLAIWFTLIGGILFGIEMLNLPNRIEKPLVVAIFATILLFYNNVFKIIIWFMKLILCRKDK